MKRVITITLDRGIDMITQEQANRVLHEWIGKCWHEVGTTKVYECDTCGTIMVRDENPDYFTPDGFFEVMEEINRKLIAKEPLGFDIEVYEFCGYIDYRFSNKNSLPWKVVDWVTSKEGEDERD